MRVNYNESYHNGNHIEYHLLLRRHFTYAKGSYYSSCSVLFGFKIDKNTNSYTLVNRFTMYLGFIFRST